ncbi:hypothetical protein HDV00_006535 [Rhizophlyctis rosea]|nr:hypothetical protein HDV00_006535 [Rhizophlyctis rosea]
MACTFSWSIPTLPVLNALMAACPNGILDVGAGTGYWSHLLSVCGADVVAIDNYSESKIIDEDAWRKSIISGKNEASEPKPQYYHVQNADGNTYISTGQAGKRALCFSWPRHTFGAEAGFPGYEGDVVVYIGEGEDGCTADIPTALLDTEEWYTEEDYDVPHWDGISDYCAILRRVIDD